MKRNCQTENSEGHQLHYHCTFSKVYRKDTKQEGCSQGNATPGVALLSTTLTVAHGACLQKASVLVVVVFLWQPRILVGSVLWANNLVCRISCIHIHMCVYMYIYTCASVSVYNYIYICSYMYNYTNMYTYIYIYRWSLYIGGPESAAPATSYHKLGLSLHHQQTVRPCFGRFYLEPCLKTHAF